MTSTPDHQSRGAAGSDEGRQPQANPPPSIRRAVPDDARAIAEINVAGWRAAYRGLMPAEFLASLSVDAREAAWRARLESNEDDPATAWVAERQACADRICRERAATG